MPSRSRAATVWASWSPSSSAASSTSHTPPGKDRRTSAAIRNASRVFPIPPGPVRVTSRPRDISALARDTSCRRPMSRFTSAGQHARLLPSTGNRRPRRPHAANPPPSRTTKGQVGART
ncbi:hypothetical protein GCM10012285_62890 [Streptomyces kronopolitis]|uniref:Secreted protein n=1 Tax=Streptomyces kronopolitis TaxID=1612435 RepID=A0ABQ2K574_9ACTN|nr:hypothetical protein [Streptomyces kronopolitis]GGN62610.1 hypothetical protein GCM10012285_62890 [Streptomyces kronopolitis]